MQETHWSLAARILMDFGLGEKMAVIVNSRVWDFAVIMEEGHPDDEINII